MLTRIIATSSTPHQRHLTQILHRGSNLALQRCFTSEGDAEDEEEWTHPQSFVKQRFEPPDLECADPDQPPWKSRAKVISAEDFENRPRAGPYTEFESLHDARLVLSWLKQEDRDKIYQDYLDMMEEMQKEEGVTSHEYVVRIISQKYNMRSGRTAAIIELEHNEQRIRAEHPEIKLNYDVQKHIDEKMTSFIKDVYDAYGEIPPEKFTEQPYTQLKDRSSRVTPVDDIYDVDTLYKKNQDKERADAQTKLDRRKYIIDFDENSRNVSIGKECASLVEQANKNTNIYGDDRYSERWKYVANIINTKAEKKLLSDWRSGKKIKRKSNTIVAEGGKVRAATIAEEKQVPYGKWKVAHNQIEYTLRGAKQAWIEKVTKGKKDGWGRANKLPETMLSDEDSPKKEIKAEN